MGKVMVKFKIKFRGMDMVKVRVMGRVMVPVMDMVRVME